MSDEPVPQVAEGEQASARLNEGLKNCRAVVSNYRAMMADALGDPPAAESPTSTSADPQG